MALLNPGALFHQRYRIESVLGEGGFAVVYEAVDSKSGRRVALKLLKPSDGPLARDDRARFKREAGLVSRLRSRHVPRMYKFGEDSAGHMFAAFELVEGQDLSELLATRGPVDQHVARDVLVQVLEALDEAHRAGLVHRDVKPENIRVTPDPKRPGLLRATLLDFGIARATDGGHPSITRTGELIGTPRYMAPEQLMARPVTAASDLYSLGVVVFEMLVGRDALHDSSWSAQIDRLEDGHVFDSPRLQGVDAKLIDLMRRMTERDVSARIGSAGAVLAALRGEVAHDSNVPSERAATPKWLALLAVLVVAVVGVALVLSGGEPRTDAVAAPVVRHLGSIVRGDPGVAKAAVVAVDVGTPEVAIQLPAPTIEWDESGCGKPLELDALYNRDEFRSWIPKGYKPSRRHPMVVVLHGDTEGAGNFTHESVFDDTADAEGFILLAPFDGVEPWLNAAKSRAHIHETIRKIDRIACVDRERIYLIGNREGAFAALPLSCEPWVRATAIASIGVPTDARHLLECPNPAPTIWFQPSLAPRAPKYGGGGPCASRDRLPLEAVIESFQQRSVCKGEPQPTITSDDGNCEAYPCESAFELCEFEGGPFWPGQDQRASIWALTQLLGCDIGPAPTFPMLDIAWRFFEAAPPRVR